MREQMQSSSGRTFLPRRARQQKAHRQPPPGFRPITARKSKDVALFQQIRSRRITDILTSIAILLSVVALAASAHLMLKVGMSQTGRIGSEELREPIKLLLHTFSNPLVLGAMPLYAASFVAWAITLSRIQLSHAYPAMATTYVLIPLASWLLLGESITPWHWVGTIVVMAGTLTVLRAGLS